MVSQRLTRFGTMIPFLIFFVCVLIAAAPTLAQSTTATGSIQGTLTDSTGAVVPNAKMTITNKDTGESFGVTTSSAGTYNSGGLVPGEYTVRAEVKGFKTVEAGVVVRVGVVSGVNLSLQVGTSSTVVQV